MRSLVHPTLCIIARLGLFLAVVAWIVGQWWIMEITSQASMSRRGWQYCNMLRNEAIFTTSMKTDRDSPEIALTDLLSESPTINFAFHGFEFRTYNTVRFLRVPHWLVVIIFTLFNCVLMWVCRKRGKELATNE